MIQVYYEQCVGWIAYDPNDEGDMAIWDTKEGAVQVYKELHPATYPEES